MTESPWRRGFGPGWMTEAQWRTCSDPEQMLTFLDDRGRDRKARLFACACCRRIAHLLSDPAALGTLEVVERYADSLAAPAALSLAHGHAAPAAREDRSGAAMAILLAATPGRFHAGHAGGARSYAAHTVWYATHTGEVGLWDAERRAQADLLRCLFGPLPFRQVRLEPAWRTPTAEAVARAAYDERLPEGAFDPTHLAVLADALEDAGCAEPDIMDHCRAPGPHARGCWVVDLLLNKA